MKNILAVVLILAAGVWWLTRPAPIKDTDFKRTVAFVEKHSSEKYVKRAMTSTATRFKPSDWISHFKSTTYQANYAPADPLNVVILSWGFLESSSLKDVYATGLKFLVLAGDDRHNEIVVQGYDGWNGMRLFERRWAFPEMPSKEPYEIKQRGLLEKLSMRFMPNRPPADAKIMLPSAIISYDTRIGASGGLLDMTMETRSLHYYDDWGQRQAFYMTGVMNTVGIIDKAKGMMLKLGDTVYEADLNAKKVTQKSGPELLEAVYSDEALLKKGSQQQGVETVLNRECQVWVNGNDEVCVWKQIPLKEVSTLYGKRMVMQAVEIEENAVIYDGRFKLPQDLQPAA